MYGWITVKINRFFYRFGIWFLPFYFLLTIILFRDLITQNWFKIWNVTHICHFKMKIMLIIEKPYLTYHQSSMYTHSSRLSRFTNKLLNKKHNTHDKKYIFEKYNKSSSTGKFFTTIFIFFLFLIFFFSHFKIPASIEACDVAKLPSASTMIKRKSFDYN